MSAPSRPFLFLPPIPLFPPLFFVPCPYSCFPVTFPLPPLSPSPFIPPISLPLLSPPLLFLPYLPHKSSGREAWGSAVSSSAGHGGARLPNDVWRILTPKTSGFPLAYVHSVVADKICPRSNKLGRLSGQNNGVGPHEFLALKANAP